jgi:hypothetical protein
VPELDPAAAGAANGQALLACAVFTPAAPLAAYRIGVRVLNPVSAGTKLPAESVPLGALVAAPNPFSRSVGFYYRSERGGTVFAQVCDANGRVVRLLAAGPALAGAGQLTWDGRDASGRRAVPSTSCGSRPRTA